MSPAPPAAAPVTSSPPAGRGRRSRRSSCRASRSPSRCSSADPGVFASTFADPLRVMTPCVCSSRRSTRDSVWRWFQPHRRGAVVDGIQISTTADVDSTARLGLGTTVWHLASILEKAQLGRECIIGRGAYVGPGVILGDRVKLQNYALVYEPARLEDEVFIGPAAVLTNDMFPRSADVGGKLKRPDDWDADGVLVREGASLGARAVVLPGRLIGRW